MTTKKRTGDPIDDLPATSRRVLEHAPSGGRYEVPYTVGRVFRSRGWGEHLGKSSGHAGSGMPTSLFQLNPQGLAAAKTARMRSRSDLDRTVYAAVHEATTGGMSDLLEAASLDQLIRDAEALVARVQQAGQSAAGAYAYVDALVEYRDAQESVTA